MSRESASGKPLIKHGQCFSPTYRSWAGMKNRCLNPNEPAYRNYGGRGIKVCERWMEFTNFLADMGERQVDQSIERLDVNGNYEPGNCIWADDQTQGDNRRDTVRITVDGVTKTLKEWSAITSIPRANIYFRLKSGWPPKRLFDPTYTQLDPNRRNARKLSWEKADEIRQFHRTSGLSHRAVAKQYGIAKSMVGVIVNNKCWVITKP